MHIINKSYNTIFGINFEVGNEGKRYVRVIYNFKQALAIIGGIITSILSVGEFVMKPLYRE